MRLEPVPSALGNPDTLVYGIDQTLNDILDHLQDPLPRSVPPLRDDEGNPLRAYYRACEQALLEALVLIQADRRQLDARERDDAFAELRRAIRHHANRDLVALAEVFRPVAGAHSAHPHHAHHPHSAHAAAHS